MSENEDRLYWMNCDTEPTPEQIEEAFRATFAKLRQYNRYDEVDEIAHGIMVRFPWIYQFLRREKE